MRILNVVADDLAESQVTLRAVTIRLRVSSAFPMTTARFRQPARRRRRGYWVVKAGVRSALSSDCEDEDGWLVG